MTLDNTWFSEPHPASGSAFSLQIEERLFAQQSPYQFVEVYATVGFGNLMVITTIMWKFTATPWPPRSSCAGLWRSESVKT